MKGIRVYVGCSLKFASSDFLAEVTALKTRLHEKGFQVLEFLGPEVGTCRDVWKHDMHTCVGECDLFVAIADYPSTGLGIEIGLAIGRHKTPVLIFAHAERDVTRIVQDPDEEDVMFSRYINLVEDISQAVEKYIESNPALKCLWTLVRVRPLEKFTDPATRQTLYRPRPELPLFMPK